MSDNNRDWQIGGIDAADRLMRQVRNETRVGSDPAPTPLQVAYVLHALADHTAIMQALEYRPPLDSPWPKATSVGRWLHDLGDYVQRKGVS
jgi:hypothetical protein